MALSELRLGQLKPADGSTTVGEVHFSKNILHLPFDGSNGATSTSDLSNQNNSVTVNGAQISTAQSKFGGSSMLFDGSNDYLSVGGSEWNSNLNSGDFTVEFWIRFNAVGTCYIIENYNGSNGWGIALWSGGGGTNYLDGFWHDGGWKYIQYGVGGSSQYTTPSADTWYHVAFVRDGNDWALYLNGTAEGTRTGLSGSITSSSNGSLDIGRRFSDTYFVDGYIDDLRITKGLARYTSNFTPPTSAHLTSAGDVNKHIIVNSSADGVAIGTGGINQARIAKAWAHFDGSGPTVNASYNISSITDSAVGKFTANFSEAMADTNYTMHVQGGNGDSPSSAYIVSGRPGAFATGSCPFHVVYVGGSGPAADWYDYADIAITFFGN